MAGTEWNRGNTADLVTVTSTVSLLVVDNCVCAHVISLHVDALVDGVSVVDVGVGAFIHADVSRF